MKEPNRRRNIFSHLRVSILLFSKVSTPVNHEQLAIQYFTYKHFDVLKKNVFVNIKNNSGRWKTLKKSKIIVDAQKEYTCFIFF